MVGVRPWEVNRGTDQDFLTDQIFLTFNRYRSSAWMRRVRSCQSEDGRDVSAIHPESCEVALLIRATVVRRGVSPTLFTFPL